jgi:hypothetical protein
MDVIVLECLASRPDLDTSELCMARKPINTGFLETTCRVAVLNHPSFAKAELAVASRNFRGNAQLTAFQVHE